MTPGPAHPFQAAPGAHILGQPFTVTKINVPVTCEVTCNCVPGNTPIPVTLGTLFTCPACGHTFQTGAIPKDMQVLIARVSEDKVPS